MPLEEVVQSLRLQSSSKSYSELGSCPTLSGNNRPLLARTIPSKSGEESSRPTEEMVQTATGPIMVAREGDPRKPAIVTYHDLALNYLSNFSTFFNSPAMAAVLETFCIYHVTAPGMEPGADELPDDFTYPTMDQLSEQVEYVLHYYGIPQCVCFGVGLGANVLARFARRRPTMVDGLVLFNCSSQVAGWVEWVYHKVNIKSLKKSTALTLPDGVIEYLLWYHLGRAPSEGSPSSSSSASLDALSLSSIYKQHFSSEVNPRNLGLLVASYMQRTDLALSREVAANGKPMLGSARSLRPPVLNMTGDRSPHVDATVAFNGRLQPNRCTWMKLQDCAMVLEEQPAKVAEAVKLFLQGLGYIMRPRKAASTQGTPVKRLVELQNQDSNASSAAFEALSVHDGAAR